MANYLYNGIELPELPEWDKEAYPQAMIACYNYSALATRLYVDKEFRYTHYDTGRTMISTSANSRVYYLRDGKWDGPEEISDAGNICFLDETDETIDWTNFDVLNKDGSVYFAASDPIPVNPAPTLDPTSLLMGWQVGNRIRQRTKGATE